MAARIATSTEPEPIRTLVLGVYTPFNKITDPADYNEEFLSLVKTAGIHATVQHFMKVRTVDNNMFLTKGKLEEVQKICEENDIEEVLFSTPLSPIQERNLSDYLTCEVHDREHLILTIFKQAAQSGEGKIQVEIAELDYFKTRTIGKGHEFAQQAGYLGNKGPGETAKEVLKRLFEEKTRQAKKKLATLQRSRDIQRKQRLSGDVPLICIIGYTNSGKSSLLNRITKSNVLAEDKLFATLDTTTRELFLDKDRRLLVSDTVGFISELPHHLIEAFKSTLDELQYADLLLHVVDSRNSAWKNQIDVVNAMLAELAIDKPIMYLFNKQDLLSENEREQLIQEIGNFTPHLLIDTKSAEGVEPLLKKLRKLSIEKRR